MVQLNFLSSFKAWCLDHLNGIDGIGENSRRARKALIFVSVCVMFVDQNVKLTLGKASLGGLGVEISPQQIIPVYDLLIVFLVYLFISFLASVLTENGTDFEKAERTSWKKVDPGFFENIEEPRSQNELAKVMANDAVTKWEWRKIIWEIFFPILFALSALTKFGYNFLMSGSS